MKTFTVLRDDIVDRFDPINFLLKNKVFGSCNYKKYKISDLCEIRDGDHNKLPIKYITIKENGIRYLRAQDLKYGEIDSTNPIYISREYYNTIPRSHIKPGYFLFSIMATIGSIAVVPKDFEECTANRAIGYLIIRDNSILDVYYLFSFFSINAGISLLQSIKKGGLQQRINLTDVANLEIPVPPMPIQERIIQIINEAYSKKKQNEEEAERLYASIDDYLLSELGIKKIKLGKLKNYSIDSSRLLTKRIDPFYHQPIFKKNEQSILSCKYDILQLSEIACLIRSGQRPKGGVRNITKGIPSLGGEHINDLGFVAQTDLKYITEDFHQSHLDSKILPKDILLVKDGATTGKVGFVPDNYPFKEVNINEHLLLIRIKDEFDPFYIFCFLNSSVSQIQIKREITGATITGLVKDSIEQLVVPVPPIEVQRRISIEIKQRIEKAEKLKYEGINYLEQSKKEAGKILFGRA